MEVRVLSWAPPHNFLIFLLLTSNSEWKTSNLSTSRHRRNADARRLSWRPHLSAVSLYRRHRRRAEVQFHRPRDSRISRDYCRLRGALRSGDASRETSSLVPILQHPLVGGVVGGAGNHTASLGSQRQSPLAPRATYRFSKTNLAAQGSELRLQIVVDPSIVFLR